LYVRLISLAKLFKPFQYKAQSVYFLFDHNRS
jgi:hypothetical protein